MYEYFTVGRNSFVAKAFLYNEQGIRKSFLMAKSK